MVNLDDANQSVFYIPFDEGDQEQGIAPEEFGDDMIDGNKIRWDAYKATWSKCLDRVQALVHALYKPVTAEIVDKIETAYDDDGVPLALPHPELPTIAVTNPSSDAFFSFSIISQLSDDRDNPNIIAHLHPSDCSNLANVMKSIIFGFISSSAAFKASSRSLASYDIAVLEAWYIAQETKPARLVLLLHDFEQFDPVVLQDVIYICSLHVPQIPLVLLIFLSSPQSPLSYLHIAYPRSTLKLLRIHSVIAPGGSQIFQDIVMKISVDLWNDSDIVLGPAALEYLLHYAARFNPSLDATLNILQIVHLKHFFSSPLTALVHSTPAIETLRDSAAFLDILRARLRYDGEFSSEELKKSALGEATSVEETRLENVSDLVGAIDDARNRFQIRVREMRLGYLLLQLIHDFLLERGYKGLGPHWGILPSATATAGGAAAVLPSSTPSSAQYLYIENYISLLQRDTELQSRAHKDIRYARTLLRKLKSAELRGFLDTLVEYLEGLPEDVAQALDLDKVMSRLERWREKADSTYEGASSSAEGAQDGEEGQSLGVITTNRLAEKLGEWIFDYLMILTEPLENTSLWDLWYTGMTPFPSETVNPSVHASILAGLLRPKDFSTGVDEENLARIEEEEDDSIWRLPDTSILFHRYLESGKLVNIYDWFESFHAVLGIQRREEAAGKQKFKGKGGSSRKHTRKTPKSELSNGKGKGKAIQEEDEGEEVGNEEEDNIDEERWNLAVQARFIRALHELDFIGFLKHTRRKPDHVVRTIFEVAE